VRPQLADISPSIFSLGFNGGGARCRRPSNLRAVRYESSQLSLDVALPDRAAADALLKRLTDAGLASQLQNVSGAAPQSLARIVITGNTP
jgi:hypothetical protein